jgi:hypothetical protein
VITCINDLSICELASNTYIIPAIIVNNECPGGLITTYQITGAVNRSGVGVDASGNFGLGTSIITWTAEDACGNKSICSTTVTVNPTKYSSTDVIICNNNLPYTWNSISITAAGTYKDTLVSATGCDSVATLVLTVNPVVTSTTNTTICSSALPYVWNGNNIAAAGTYKDTLTSSTGL